MPQRAKPVASYLRSLVGDVDAFAERVATRGAPVPHGLEAKSGRDQNLAPALQRLRAQGVQALEALRDGRDVDPTLKPGLEAIVCLEARPAIGIRGGNFDPPPAEWSKLEAHRDRIREVIARVGRVEVTGHPELAWVGTGFLAGSRTLMTNRHVAGKFMARHGDEWAFKPEMSSSFDLLREEGSTDTRTFAILELLAMHDRYDLALLRVEDRSPSEASSPTPLTISANAPREIGGRDVYVVGYPSSDRRRNESTVMQEIFADRFGVKRLQPGRLLPYRDGDYDLKHDCCTLGGNSGSPVVDLETHRVLGLHFSGCYLEANFAVPLWVLATDPLLRAADVQFA